MVGNLLVWMGAFVCDLFSCVPNLLLPRCVEVVVLGCPSLVLLRFVVLLRVVGVYCVESLVGVGVRCKTVGQIELLLGILCKFRLCVVCCMVLGKMLLVGF